MNQAATGPPVGHSSAGTIALQVGAADPRIRGVVAFAPVCDVLRHLGPDTVRVLDMALPGFASFLHAESPSARLADLRAPVLLFAAHDDRVVPSRTVAKCRDALASHNPEATLARVDRGGHYDAMIDRGIPLAITWVREQFAP